MKIANISPGDDRVARYVLESEEPRKPLKQLVFEGVRVDCAKVGDVIDVEYKISLYIPMIVVDEKVGP